MILRESFSRSSGVDASGAARPTWDNVGVQYGLGALKRGQITPQHRLMELEVHITKIEKQPGRVLLQGDASLWVDDLRIYQVKNLTVGILEGNE